MAENNANDARPMECVKSFDALIGGQAAIREMLKSVHAQTIKANGHVDDLYNIAGLQGNRITALETMTRCLDLSHNKWVDAAWKIATAIAMALLLAKISL